MIPAIPHMSFDLRRWWVARTVRTQTRLAAARQVSPLRKDVEILVHVPVGDGRAEALPLVALVVHEDGVHLARQCLLDDLVLLERIEGVSEGHRYLLDLLAGLHGSVDVSLLRLARVELPLDP